MPAAESNSWTTAVSPLTSSTLPRRMVPSLQLHFHQLVVGDALDLADHHQRADDLFYGAIFLNHQSSPPFSRNLVDLLFHLAVRSRHRRSRTVGRHALGAADLFAGGNGEQLVAHCAPLAMASRHSTS
jgi:hypothetical protein